MASSRIRTSVEYRSYSDRSAVAGPGRDVDSNLPTQWETVGRLEADFEIDRDSPLYFESQDDGGTITLESAQPYFYERGSTRDYQDTYDEAMQVLKDGLISAAGGGPLSTPASAARVLIVSESMTTAGAVIAFNRGQSELQNVVDGNSDSEFDTYNSVIYEHTEHQGTVYGAGEIVDVDAAGTGPVMLRVNELDVEDDQ